MARLIIISCGRSRLASVLQAGLLKGQVDLAETDENGNENERGNENEKGNGRQEGSKCGIGRRSCKPTFLCKIAWCIQRLVTG